ncbi:TPA: DUF5983 family protein [Escherichia coli]|nr:DUF4942 domain-containing protein [Escherichia coli]EGT8342754.1 DUF4942 domain-containing protein [Escherichia coli]
MKLTLTLEADSINVQALNMERIVVDVDGIELAELINKVAENGYSLRVVDAPEQQTTDSPPSFTALTGIRCSKGRYEDEMFIIKYFKKGSAHITFKRLELIDRINDIIARHFPSVLSA